MSIHQQPTGTIQWRYALPKDLQARTGRRYLTLVMSGADDVAAGHLAGLFTNAARLMAHVVQSRNLDAAATALVLDRFQEWAEAALNGWHDTSVHDAPSLPAEDKRRAMADLVVETIRDLPAGRSADTDPLARFLKDALSSLIEASTRPVIVRAPTANERLGSGDRTDSDLADNGTGTATITSLIESFQRDIALRATEATASNYAYVAKLFAEAIGDLPVAEVKPFHVHQFVDLAHRIPILWYRRYKRRDPNLSLLEIIERYPDAPKLAPRTVKEYLIALTMFFEWAEDNAYIWRTPVRRVRVAPDKTYTEARDPYSLDDLKLIFERSPLFTGCASTRFVSVAGPERVFDHRFWFPLIALFSGLRINEIVILRPNEISEVEGIPCFDLRERGQEAKTRFSRRIVPDPS